MNWPLCTIQDLRNVKYDLHDLETYQTYKDTEYETNVSLPVAITIKRIDQPTESSRSPVSMIHMSI